jgi:hypothetical protein
MSLLWSSRTAFSQPPCLLTLGIWNTDRVHLAERKSGPPNLFLCSEFLAELVGWVSACVQYELAETHTASTCPILPFSNIIFKSNCVSIALECRRPLLSTNSGHEVYMWSLVGMAGGEGATQRVTRSMSEAMQESGKKDRVKELLRTALETAGWRESVRLASDSVIAEAHPTKLSAKEIAGAVRESALGTFLSPRPWKYDSYRRPQD